MFNVYKTSIDHVSNYKLELAHLNNTYQVEN